MLLKLFIMYLDITNTTFIKSPAEQQPKDLNCNNESKFLIPKVNLTSSQGQLFSFPVVGMCELMHISDGNIKNPKDTRIILDVAFCRVYSPWYLDLSTHLNGLRNKFLLVV